MLSMPFLDVDTTDEFLDLPEPRYRPDGKTASLEATDALLEKAKRGEADLPKLPPPTDH